MDITVPPEVEKLAARTREFVRDVVIPGRGGDRRVDTRRAG